MELINYTEVLVKQHFDEVIGKFDDVCKCQQCKFDILALALNKLPPKYVVSEKGAVFSKAQSFTTQSNVDVVGAITDAINKVKGRPNHI